MISNGNGTQEDKIRSIERGIVVSPRDPELRLSLARVYTRAERLPEAEAAYRKAIKLVGQNPTRYLEIVTEAQDNGLGWVGQPLPDFARYSIGQLSPTYAAEVHSVRTDETAVYQPTILINRKPEKRMLTPEEIFRARIEDYNTLTDEQGNPRTKQQRLKLFNTWFSTPTGIGYKPNSTKFKIDRISPQLADIPEGFNSPFIEIDWSAIQGEELDRSEAIYNQRRTKEQALNHKAWNIIIPNPQLLKEYADIASSEIRDRQRLMGFWLTQNPKKGKAHLCSLVLNDLGDDSDAYAGWGLLSVAQSLRVVGPKVNLAEGEAEKLDQGL